MNTKDMRDFIKVKESEVNLCKKLLDFRSSTKVGEDFSVQRLLIQHVEEAMEECVQLMGTYIKLQAGGNRSKRILDNMKNIDVWTKSLKKQTYLLGNTMVYEDQILTALDRATTKFVENADK